MVQLHSERLGDGTDTLIGCQWLRGLASELNLSIHQAFLYVSEYATTGVNIKRDRRGVIDSRCADLNLPLCGIAFGIVFLFLRLRKPPVQSYVASVKSMDWM